MGQGVPWIYWLFFTGKKQRIYLGYYLVWVKYKSRPTWICININVLICHMTPFYWGFIQAWQLKVPRFQFTLSHKLLFKNFNCNWLFIQFSKCCDILEKCHFSCPTLNRSTSQKPQPLLFTINIGGVKRYRVDPSQLLSLLLTTIYLLKKVKMLVRPSMKKTWSEFMAGKLHTSWTLNYS